MDISTSAIYNVVKVYRDYAVAVGNVSCSFAQVRTSNSLSIGLYLYGVIKADPRSCMNRRGPVTDNTEHPRQQASRIYPGSA